MWFFLVCTVTNGHLVIWKNWQMQIIFFSHACQFFMTSNSVLPTSKTCFFFSMLTNSAVQSKKDCLQTESCCNNDKSHAEQVWAFLVSWTKSSIWRQHLSQCQRLQQFIKLSLLSTFKTIIQNNCLFGWHGVSACAFEPKTHPETKIAKIFSSTHLKNGFKSHHLISCSNLWNNCAKMGNCLMVQLQMTLHIFSESVLQLNWQECCGVWQN